MWSFGWSTQETMSYFQEEMAYLSDTSVVSKFFCVKFITFYAYTLLPFLQLFPFQHP